MEKKNFEKLHEYKRKYLYDLFAKAKECSDEIDLEHNLDEVNEKLLKELREALRNMVTFS